SAPMPRISAVTLPLLPRKRTSTAWMSARLPAAAITSSASRWSSSMYSGIFILEIVIVIVLVIDRLIDYEHDYDYEDGPESRTAGRLSAAPPSYADPPM